MKDLNPFQRQENNQAVVQVESNRAMQEVQAAMVIAKKFPRDRRAAASRILDACTRDTLANQSLYTYPKGGQQIEGPSIRLAEAIGQEWGNFEYGIIELEQSNGKSMCQAYAWDLETNTRKVINFHVEHSRYSKSGGTKQLTDHRDIYEMVSNQGSRRVRNCILAIIPGDVTEAAVKQCKVTQANNNPATPETITAMIEAFEKLGITKVMINKRLGHDINGIKTPQLINLRRIYQSISDGIGQISDFFEIDENAPPKPKTPKELPVITEKQFGKSLIKWLRLISEGKKTADELIAFLSTKNKLTPAQIKALKEPLETINVEQSSETDGSDSEIGTEEINQGEES